MDAVLEADGWVTKISVPGPDGGVDILAGRGSLGLDTPRLCVQVKSQNSPADVTVYRTLQGTMQTFKAEQGLLVCWGGFNKVVLAESRQGHFMVRLWDSRDLVGAIYRNYERLPAEIQAELPLKRVGRWDACRRGACGMIADLKPYPAYKDSGVRWLGSVPDRWSLKRTKFLFREKDHRAGDEGGTLLSLTRARGLLPQAEASKRIASVEDLSNYRVCRPGDLVMNRMQAWSGMFAVSSCDGVVSPDYSVFEATVASEVKFFEHLFKTPLLVAQFALRSKGIGSGFNRLYEDDFGDVPVPLPPLPEQAAIVRFLDHADRRIRRYIRAKQKLIKLLEEQKQALIHQSVTRGLDPNVRLKPSGVEWLGDVPEHWAVRRVKTLCSMRSGESITAESIETTGEYPVYGGNGLRGYASSYTHDGAFALIGRQGALCGNVHVARGKFWASEHAVVATLDRGHVLDWFGAILRVMNLNQYSIAAAQPGLSVERVLNLRVSVPPMQEQEGIANHIERDTADIDTALAPARRQIDLLQEYRTRLIADVVTGKLDVREAAASLLEEADERDPLDEVVLLADDVVDNLYHRVGRGAGNGK